MQIQTTRFGVVAVEKSDLITLTEGLLGFNDLKTFVILEDPDDLIFAWLQSCEKPAVAFPILEPELFSADYKVRLTKADRESIGLFKEKGAYYVPTLLAGHTTSANADIPGYYLPMVAKKAKEVAPMMMKSFTAAVDAQNAAEKEYYTRAWPGSVVLLLAKLSDGKLIACDSARVEIKKNGRT
jgi:hypothetical protein